MTDSQSNLERPQDLDIHDLVEQYTDMVKWYHYDPMGAARPSAFDQDELANEILRRMRGKPRVSRELLDQFTDMVKWCHYDPMGAPRPSPLQLGDLHRDVIQRMVPAPGQTRQSDYGGSKIARGYRFFAY